MALPPLHYQIALSGGSWPVAEVHGVEAISEPFRFTVRWAVDGAADIDPNALVKGLGQLQLCRAGVGRSIDGVVTELCATPHPGGATEVELILEPRFALARLRSNLKVYRDKSVPDMVAEVLGELGVSFSLRLGDSYPVRPYTVQFRETDFHFVSRLLEEEGIFYFFAPGDVMIIGDGQSAYDDAGAIPVIDPSALNRNEAGIWSIGERSATSVGLVSLRDWNAETPSLPMDVQAAGPSPSGPELYDYPGEYKTPAEGQRIANKMAEAYAAAAGGTFGRAYAEALGAGIAFSPLNAPGALAGSGRQVVTRLEHRFHREQAGYSTDFEAVPTSVPFRPPRRHHEPVLPNPLTGVVTGPPGEDIHTDALGRVKVHFHWDRLQPRDDACSDWVPVAQDNTGHSVAIPRVGWEVLVHFMEGDPDRPVVLGRLYNGEDRCPVKLPEAKHITSLGSLSSPTRDGTNEILLKDLQGEEQIQLFAERNQDVVVANDRFEQVLSSRQTGVGRNEVIAVDKDVTMQVGQDLAQTVGGTSTLNVAGDLQQSVALAQLDVLGARSLVIGSNHHRRISTTDTLSAPSLTERVGGALLEASVASNTLSAAAALTLNVGGAVLELVKGDKYEAFGYGRAETIGGVVLTKAKGCISIDVPGKRVTTVGGLLRICANKELALVGTEGFSMKSASHKYDGAEEITLKVGDSVVTMKDELISIKATGTIAFKIEGENALGSDEAYQN